MGKRDFKIKPYCYADFKHSIIDGMIVVHGFAKKSKTHNDPNPRKKFGKVTQVSTGVFLSQRVTEDGKMKNEKLFDSENPYLLNETSILNRALKWSLEGYDSWAPTRNKEENQLRKLLYQK